MYEFFDALGKAILVVLVFYVMINWKFWLKAYLNQRSNK